jgi:hypothetical protein
MYESARPYSLCGLTLSDLGAMACLAARRTGATGAAVAGAEIAYLYIVGGPGCGGDVAGACAFAAKAPNPREAATIRGPASEAERRRYLIVPLLPARAAERGDETGVPGTTRPHRDARVKPPRADRVIGPTSDGPGSS